MSEVGDTVRADDAPLRIDARTLEARLIDERAVPAIAALILSAHSAMIVG
jgi:hypothetical protein